jgi:hypothetical protein
MNITMEQDYRKKNSEFDEMFWSLLEKVNRNLKEKEKARFDVKTKTLYINGAIKANDINFIALCDSYKFWLQKELF